MRRTDVNEARRRQAAAERRFRGHRIRGGLDELGDLDVPQKQRERKDAAPSPVAITAAAAAATSTVSAPAAESPLLSHSTAVSTTVFGIDWSEWLEVKRVLFDTEATVEAKRTALDRMQVWHLRARKERQLPPYVEATEVLLNAMLQDEADALADGAQRMCYGAAVSRVVHIMTGSFASGSADTYRKRAQEIGFPEEAVEVRQRVAHGALPLASELRWVCGLALQFIFTEYWLEQERQLYLMEAIDMTPVVRSRNTEPEAKAKKRTGAQKPECKAAVPSQTAAPPPLVSMDDMKALLDDLEDDEENANDVEIATKGTTSAQERISSSAGVETSATTAKKKPSGAASGWVIS